MAQNGSVSHEWRNIVCAHCGHEIAVLVDCKNRFCPECAPRRSARIANRLQFLVNKIQKRDRWRLKMITLSMANCSDVQKGIKQLVASFRRLRNRRLWKTHVDGGAFVIEVTGRPGNWHPHIHAVVYSRFIPWKNLWRDWKQCSGGNAVYITATSLEGAIKYITKYISKSAVPSHLWEELSIELRRFRLFQRFGSWHNIALPSRVFDYRCESCGRCDWLADVYYDHIAKRYPVRYG